MRRILVLVLDALQELQRGRIDRRDEHRAGVRIRRDRPTDPVGSERERGWPMVAPWAPVTVIDNAAERRDGDESTACLTETGFVLVHPLSIAGVPR